MKSLRQPKKNSILDRRIKAIEKEKAQLNLHIKRLAKETDKQTSISVPPVAAAPRITTTVPNPHAVNEPVKPLVQEQDDTRSDTSEALDHDLFSWSDKRVMNAPVSTLQTIKEDIKGEEEEEPEEMPFAPPVAHAAKSPSPAIDRRLASYLTSGSFAPSGYKRTPRPIQRNKLIFIVVVVIIVLFVALKLLRVF